MLSADDLRRWTARFGVADEQVERDHLISHILLALADRGLNTVTFYGGTALSRTHLLDFRLSEDVDLVGEPRPVVARQIEDLLPRALRTEFGAVGWDPSPAEVMRDTTPALLRAGDLQVRIQVIALDADYSRWPTERRAVALRYQDLSPYAVLRVPTISAFVAMKTIAWEDRQAPRDLADLHALGQAGAINASVLQLFKAQTGRSIGPQMFEQSRLPDEGRWNAQLGHQMAVVPDRVACLEEVRRIYGQLLGWRARPS